MIGVGESWPVRIGAVGSIGVSPGTVVWRVRGAEEIRITVIAKVTLEIVPEGEMTVREPDALVLHDAHYHADSQCSLRVASDLAPYLGQGEVILTGHSYAPPERPTPMAGARLVVHREGQVLVSKTIRVQGDLRGERGQLADPAPFQRMPLIYERAVHHPELNPVGVDPARGTPNLMHGSDPSLPGCFGPIARHWPARHRLLQGLDPRQIDGARMELPEGFTWAYFQVAPPDQRLDYLQGNEGILLGGMHPSLPMVRSRMPGVRAVACVYPDRDGEGERLPLWADTLLIDTDRQVCSLVWRGNFGVTDEAMLRSIRIRAGAELPGAPLVFPGEAGGGPRSVDGPRSADRPLPDVSPEVAAEAQPEEPEEVPSEELIEEVTAAEEIEPLPDDAIEPVPEDDNEDEDAIATRGAGFPSPVRAAAPPEAPAAPAEPPAGGQGAAPAEEDEDEIVTPRGNRPSGA